MEKKDNKGIIIALCTVIVVLIGSVIYMFVSGAVSFDVIEENKINTNEQKVEDKENVEIGDTKKIKVLSGEYGDSATTIILYNGEVYISMMNCAPGNDRFTYVCDPVDKMINSYKKYEFEGLEYDSLFEYPLEESKFTGLKLNVKEVQNIYSVEQGQGFSIINQGLALVKNDGTLEVISYQNIFDNNLTPTKVANLQNIVKVENVTESDGVYTYAIDSDGSKHSLFASFK